MVWARIDDAILDNPKIAKVGVFGFALHVAAITWCCRNLSDGFIPYARVTALLPLEFVQIDSANPLALPFGARSMGGETGLDAHVVADHLVEAGLWECVTGGYQLHDFLQYNPSREQVLKERERSRERVNKHRNKQGSNGARNAVTNAPVTVAPVPVPVPDPVPEEETPPIGGVGVAVAPPPRESGKRKKAVKHKFPETKVPSSDAYVDEVDAWAESWGIDHRHPSFLKFLNHHRHRETLGRDWFAGWNFWLAGDGQRAVRMNVNETPGAGRRGDSQEPLRLVPGGER